MEGEELLDLFDKTTIDGIVGTTKGQYLKNLLTKAYYYGVITDLEVEIGYDIIELDTDLEGIDTWREIQVSASVSSK